MQRAQQQQQQQRSGSRGRRVSPEDGADGQQLRRRPPRSSRS
jgi:hypothetical protein